MDGIFKVTMFTGQQLVLEAIQRWLARPCADADAARRQRRSLKGLLSLLLRTAATGVLATVLDAAIEFRRRQLLAAAAAEPGSEDDAGSGAGRFPGLGMLSRAGVAAWKARLLLAIDELERRAEAYGIESRHRFSPGKPAGEESFAQGSGKAGGGEAAATDSALSEEERSRLGRTVQQLRELVKQGDAEAERRLDDEVGSLVDLLLGTAPLPSPAGSASGWAAGGARERSRSVPAALDLLGRRAMGEGAASGLRACRSRVVLAAPPPPADAEEPGSPSSSSDGSGCSAAAASEVCQICMDHRVKVQVADCRHGLCFGCARQLCAGQDHQVPQCPFCRQAINGFVAIAAAPAEGAACRPCMAPCLSA